MTSDNLPARLDPEPSREIARTDTDSWTGMFADVIELARGIADTEFVPRGLRGSIPATTAAILYGREVGFPPMTALNNTHVIEGRPSIAAEAMRAMVIAAGHDIEVLETTGGVCRMRARRRSTERWTPEVVWTIDMARAAGLLNKNNWKNHPRRMLQARCSSELCELYFPDVVLGFKSIEEMTDEVDGEYDDRPAAAVPSTKVARKRAPRKAAALPPAPVGAQAERPVMDGPPLPGEEGFDPEPAPVSVDQSSAGGGDGDEPGGSVGEDVPPPVDDDQEPIDIGDAPVVDEDPKPGPSTRAQHRMLFGRLGALSVDDSERLAYVSALIGREVESFNNISKAEAHTLIETLALVEDRVTLDGLVDAATERRG